MKVTEENVEEIINKLTIDFILENGILRERLEKRDWMTKTDMIIYMEKMDMESMSGIFALIDKLDPNAMDDGSTLKNMLDQFKDYMEKLNRLSNRGNLKV